MAHSKYVIEVDYDVGEGTDRLWSELSGVCSVEPLSAWLETHISATIVDRDRNIGSLNVRIRQLEAERERILAAVREMLLDPANGEWEDDHSFVQRMLAFGMPKLSTDATITVTYKGTLQLRVENVDRHISDEELASSFRDAVNVAIDHDELLASLRSLYVDDVEGIQDALSIESFTLTTDS